MASDTAIADTGETLVTLLIEELGDSFGKREVVLGSPEHVNENDDVRLTLYLYDVSENAYLRNDRPPSTPGARTTPGAPLQLDLRYLLTAYPSTGVSDETANTLDQHEVLGHAMQVLNDNPVVAGSDLVGSFDDDEALSISIVPESMDTVVSVWNTFTERPYRPSVAYIVTPVVIESAHETDAGRRVTDRELTEHVPASRGADDG